MAECCNHCTYYEEEWEYCFRLGTHAPKDGYCQNYREELKLPSRHHGEAGIEPKPEPSRKRLKDQVCSNDYELR